MLKPFTAVQEGPPKDPGTAWLSVMDPVLLVALVTPYISRGFMNGKQGWPGHVLISTLVTGRDRWLQIHVSSTSKTC